MVYFKSGSKTSLKTTHTHTAGLQAVGAAKPARPQQQSKLTLKDSLPCTLPPLPSREVRARCRCSSARLAQRQGQHLAQKIKHLM